MRIGIVFLLLTLYGCANPYAKYYDGMPDARQLPWYVPSSGELKIYGSDDFNRDIRALRAKGFRPVGESAFNAAAGSFTDKQLRAQAETIGAHIVLIASKYSHTESGSVPLTLPNTTTSHVSGSATAFGPRGPVTAYGSGTVTTYGTQTTYLPYTVDRKAVNAVFLVKAKSLMGVVAEALDDETRQKIQSNSGVLIDIVIEGTPAYEADILPGDVLLAINGVAVRSKDHYNELLMANAGSTAELSLYRGDRTITKSIQIQKP